MTDMKQPALSDIVQISRQYQRSIRVDTDIGRADALSGYICHATAASVVDGMCKQLGPSPLYADSLASRRLHLFHVGSIFCQQRDTRDRVL